jgi:putative RNA 2'-phosphotransferase
MDEDRRLAKILHFILARQPDAFGLVPDRDGFYPINDVLHVLREEKWPNVRRNDLIVLNCRLAKPEIEVDAGMIRAIDRRHLPSIAPEKTPPKLLFACVRRKAYQSLLRDGLHTPLPHIGHIALFADSELAKTVGRRKDRSPILVTVHTTLALRLGLAFERFGENIILAPAVPAECCTLPPPPPQDKKRSATDAPEAKGPAGSFAMDWQHFASAGKERPPAEKSSKRRASQRRPKRRRSSK